LKPVSGKQLVRVLKGWGWTLQRIKGSHHHFVHPTRSNPVVVPVHGNKTLKPKTQRSIMKAAGLTDDDL
jgi:predicted RNA binding protein YcfA (HicA-like mRNA interferase family)